MLTVLVTGALCDFDTTAVAEQDGNVAFKFHDSVFVFHKTARSRFKVLTEWYGISAGVDRRQAITPVQPCCHKTPHAESLMFAPVL